MKIEQFTSAISVSWLEIEDNHFSFMNINSNNVQRLGDLITVAPKKKVNEFFIALDGFISSMKQITPEQVPQFSKCITGISLLLHYLISSSIMSYNILTRCVGNFCSIVYPFHSIVPVELTGKLELSVSLSILSVIESYITGGRDKAAFFVFSLLETFIYIVRHSRPDRIGGLMKHIAPMRAEIQEFFAQDLSIPTVFNKADVKQKLVGLVKSELYAIITLPNAVKSQEGRVVLLASLDSAPDVIDEIDNIVRGIVMAEDHASYSELVAGVYFQCWRSMKKTVDRSVYGEACQERLELKFRDYIQMIIFGVEEKTVARAYHFMSCLLFNRRGNYSFIDPLVASLITPILFPALEAPNPKVQLQALELLCSLYPVYSIDVKHSLSNKPTVDPVDATAEHLRNEEFCTRQHQAMLVTMSCDDVNVRKSAVSSVSALLAHRWATLGEQSAHQLFKKLVLESCLDYSSADIRVAALQCVQLIAQTTSHSVPSLKVLMPALSPLIHDKQDSVILTYLELVKQIRVMNIKGLKLVSMVPVNQLFVRLSITQNLDIKRHLINFFLSTYFADDKPRNVILERLISFVSEHPHAARQFYKHVYLVVDAKRVATFAILTLRLLANNARAIIQSRRNNEPEQFPPDDPLYVDKDKVQTLMYIVCDLVFSINSDHSVEDQNRLLLSSYSNQFEHLLPSILDAYHDVASVQISSLLLCGLLPSNAGSIVMKKVLNMQVDALSTGHAGDDTVWMTIVKHAWNKNVLTDLIETSLFSVARSLIAVGGTHRDVSRHADIAGLPNSYIDKIHHILRNVGDMKVKIEGDREDENGRLVERNIEWEVDPTLDINLPLYLALGVLETTHNEAATFGFSFEVKEKETKRRSDRSGPLVVGMFGMDRYGLVIDALIRLVHEQLVFNTRLFNATLPSDSDEASHSELPPFEYSPTVLASFRNHFTERYEAFANESDPLSLPLPSRTSGSGMLLMRLYVCLDVHDCLLRCVSFTFYRSKQLLVSHQTHLTRHPDAPESNPVSDLQLIVAQLTLGRTTSLIASAFTVADAAAHSLASLTSVSDWAAEDVPSDFTNDPFSLLAYTKPNRQLWQSRSAIESTADSSSLKDTRDDLLRGECVLFSRLILNLLRFATSTLAIKCFTSYTHSAAMASIGNTLAHMITHPYSPQSNAAWLVSLLHSAHSTFVRSVCCLADNVTTATYLIHTEALPLSSQNSILLEDMVHKSSKRRTIDQYSSTESLVHTYPGFDLLDGRSVLTASLHPIPLVERSVVSTHFANLLLCVNAVVMFCNDRSSIQDNNIMGFFSKLLTKFTAKSHVISVQAVVLSRLAMDSSLSALSPSSEIHLDSLCKDTIHLPVPVDHLFFPLISNPAPHTLPSYFHHMASSSIKYGVHFDLVDVVDNAAEEALSLGCYSFVKAKQLQQKSTESSKVSEEDNEDNEENNSQEASIDVKILDDEDVESVWCGPKACRMIESLLKMSGSKVVLTDVLNAAINGSLPNLLRIPTSHIDHNNTYTKTLVETQRVCGWSQRFTGVWNEIATVRKKAVVMTAKAVVEVMEKTRGNENWVKDVQAIRGLQ